jgi:hypothetical protein
MRQSQYQEKLKEWFDQLNKYIKYNVKLYKNLSTTKNYDILFDCEINKVDNYKNEIVSLLEIQGNVRIGIYDNISDEYFLISSYEENENYKICGENENMYDDFVYVLYYIVRYSMLDSHGYYSLSGMCDFDKDKFFERYCIDIWQQPQEF